MKRTLSVVLVMTLAASTGYVAAQEGMPPASRPRFTQEAIRQAVFEATHHAAGANRLTSQPVAASGAETNRSWDTLVGSVKTGKKVKVTLGDSTNVEGKLLAINTHSISVEQPEGPRAIEIADVFRVRYAGVRKRHALYGMLIGMAGGALAGAVAYAGETLTIHERDGSIRKVDARIEAAVLYAIFFGLPAGAIGGAVLPIGQPLYETAELVRKTP